MSFALSRTRRCLEIAGADMRNGLNNVATEFSEELESRPRISRRVGSARAAKTAVMCRLLTNLLSIWLIALAVKTDHHFAGHGASGFSLMRVMEVQMNRQFQAEPLFAPRVTVC